MHVSTTPEENLNNVLLSVLLFFWLIPNSNPGNLYIYKKIDWYYMQQQHNICRMIGEIKRDIGT
jgi:hypothetical protein